jgi:hypothetical protein
MSAAVMTPLITAPCWSDANSWSTIGTGPVSLSRALKSDARFARSPASRIAAVVVCRGWFANGFLYGLRSASTPNRARGD